MSQLEQGILKVKNIRILFPTSGGPIFLPVRSATCILYSINFSGISNKKIRKYSHRLNFHRITKLICHDTAKSCCNSQCLLPTLTWIQYSFERIMARSSNFVTSRGVFPFSPNFSKRAEEVALKARTWWTSCLSSNNCERSAELQVNLNAKNTYYFRICAQTIIGY